MVITIKVDYKSVRKSMHRPGGAMTPKKGRGAYTRKAKHKGREINS